MGLARIGINGVICWYCYWLTKVFLLTLRFHDPRGPSESNQNTWPVKRFQWKNIFIFGVEFISGKDKPYWLRWSFRRCPFRNLSVGKRRRWLVNKMRAYFPSYSKLGVNHYLNRSLARGTWMSQDVSKWFVNGLYRLRSIYGDEILPSFMGILMRQYFWIPMKQAVFHEMSCLIVWVLNVAHLEYFQTSLCFNLHREPSEGFSASLISKLQRQTLWIMISSRWAPTSCK